MDVPRRPYDAVKAPRYFFRTDYLFDFLAYIKEHNSPLDFFSWHSYFDIDKTMAMEQFLHRTLTEYGYGDLETHLNEWNNAFGNENHGSSFASASVAAMMCAMQTKAHTDMLCYYDSRLQASSYGGLFAPLTYKPVCTYYSFAAFGELYALGTQAESSCADKEVYTLAATNGTEKAIMIVNTAKEDKEICLNVDGEWTVSLIDREHLLEPVEYDPAKFVLKANQVAFLKQ